MPVPLLKTAAAAAATALLGGKNGGFLNQTVQSAPGVVLVQQPTELLYAASSSTELLYEDDDYNSFDYDDGRYGYSPWSYSRAATWTESAEDFYRHVMRPCESKQWWQQNGYGWGEDDYTLSQVGGTNQDMRESDTKKCLKRQKIGFVRGTWVKTMNQGRSIEGDHWMQIGAGNFHFSSGFISSML